MGKKRFFANHSKSSALVVSLAIHAVLIVVAISFVAVKVIIKPEPDFVAKRMKRPKMPPKKLQVPVDVKKRKPKPRLRKRIVSQQKTFTDIKMPEITGVKGGLGNMGGDGLGSLGFDMDIGDLFGGNKSMGGNELTGTFYDLKQSYKGKPTGMDQGRFYAALASFAKGWNLGRLDEYFQAPKKKYATFFMIPTISSSKVTEAFGVSDTVEAVFWAAYYEGHISAPETGHYRFMGYGDDILLVRIKKRLVMDASFEPYRSKLYTGWTSDADNNRKYPIGGQRLFIGDWFRLTKDEPVKMEVLLGDVGNISSFQLLIEKRGVQYRQASYSYKEGDETITGTRPVLPVFKTKEIPDNQELIGQMKINPNQVTLEGPVFGVVK
ncbi:MAG: hypothetical protein KAU94_09655 [Verrucomicrobia bacterium]|nr:hypothetical protein [Verrucomicrobiota bacterium]